MPIISIVLTLAVLGFIAWLIMQIPMPALIQKVILGVFILLIILWLLDVLGYGTGVYFPGRVR